MYFIFCGGSSLSLLPSCTIAVILFSSFTQLLSSTFIKLYKREGLSAIQPAQKNWVEIDLLSVSFSFISDVEKIEKRLLQRCSNNPLIRHFFKRFSSGSFKVLGKTICVSVCRDVCVMLLRKQSQQWVKWGMHVLGVLLGIQHNWIRFIIWGNPSQSHNFP